MRPMRLDDFVQQNVDMIVEAINGMAILCVGAHNPDGRFEVALHCRGDVLIKRLGDQVFTSLKARLETTLLEWLEAIGASELDDEVVS